MLKSKLFQKYLILGISITVIFFLIGFFTNHLLMESERQQNMLDNPPPHMRDGKRPSKPPEFKEARKPGPRFEPGPGPGPRPGERPGDGPGPRGNRHFIQILAVQMTAVMLAVALTIFIVFTHFRGRTKEIEDVLQRIKDGDLKARMPVTTNDEFGFAFGKFNLMADEIETLINRLRDTEATRRVLLSELAHDIRTPLASVSNLLEILQGDKADKIGQEQKNEIIDMSHKEVTYISRLVEDLLFLGKIEEPSYRKKDEEVNLNQAINEVILNLDKRYPAIKSEVISNGDIDFKIDPTLSHRLFRNALENAFSFAKGKVTVEINQTPKELIIDIIDDGPGISFSGKENFGKKKFSRQEVLESVGNKRISIGLGSVIMRSIVKSYHGEISIDNNKEQAGAHLTISFKKI